MNSTEQKHELRQTVLRKLRAMSAEQLNARSAALRRALAPWLLVPRPLTVALYAALPHEVDLLPLLAEYPQHRYAFPRCARLGEMYFHIVKQPSLDLRPAALGIPAPASELPLVPPAAFDLVLVPGIAFTREGARLGYGGGYYDRYLPRCAKATWVATAYAEQLLATLPTEAHDIRLPHLVIH